MKHWTYYVAKSWQRFVTVFMWTALAATIVAFIWMNVWMCLEIPGALPFWFCAGIVIATSVIWHFIKKFHKWTEKVLEENK